jgi:hypothetical protein
MLLLFTSSEVVDGEAMIQLSDFVERSFNQVLSDLIATLDDVGETDKEQREDWIYHELMMFFDRLARVYAIQAEMESDSDASHALIHAAERFMELSDRLSDLGDADFSIFLAIHNPETSTDVFGSFNSALILQAEQK